MFNSESINNELGYLIYNTGYGNLFQIESMELLPTVRGQGKSSAMVNEALRKTPKNCRTIWGVGSPQSPLIQWANGNGFKLTEIKDLYTSKPGIVANRRYFMVAVAGCPDHVVDDLNHYMLPVVPLEQADCLLVNLGLNQTEAITKAEQLGLKIFYWHECPKGEGWVRQVFDSWATEVLG